MSTIATAGGGAGDSPADVCKTPTPAGPQPMPYPNKFLLMMANRMTCAFKVKLLNMPVLNLKSVVPMTMGDSAGVAGGVVSGKIMGEAKPAECSLKVQAMGSGVLLHGHKLTTNAMNAVAILGTPSQPKGSATI